MKYKRSWIIALITFMVVAGCGDDDAGSGTDTASDTDTDADTDTDPPSSDDSDSGEAGTDADTDGGDVPAPMTDCEGGKLAPDTGLCWMDPPYNDALLEWQVAFDHCGGLSLGGHEDWRMPAIEELRSLIRGCPSTETGGECRAAEGSDQSAETAACEGCEFDQGSGNGGCYSDPALSVPCSEWHNAFWSASAVSGTQKVWYVLFNDGSVAAMDKTELMGTLCVRGGP